MRVHAVFQMSGLDGLKGPVKIVMHFLWLGGWMLKLMVTRKEFLRRVCLDILSLTIGDIILSCNDKIVTRMYDLNVQYSAEAVDLVRYLGSLTYNSAC